MYFSVVSVGGSASALSLQEISQYLSAMDAAYGEFTQFNVDGTVDEGFLYIKKPGRMRMQYTSNSDVFIAGGGQVAIFDSRSNERPTQLPLSQTVFSVLLQEYVDLNEMYGVSGPVWEQDKFKISITDPEKPEHGSLHLFFNDEGGVSLVKMATEDGYGNITDIVLSDMVFEDNFPGSYFNILAEIDARGLNEN